MNKATLKFNLDSAEVNVTTGLTVAEAFKRNAAQLGIENGTGYTYKVGNQTVDGNSFLLPGTVVTATLTREVKG